MSCAAEDILTFDESKLTINGVEYCLNEWNFDEDRDRKDASCTGVKGKYKKVRVTQKQAKIKLGFHFNPAENVLAEPFNLNDEDYLEGIRYYPDRDDPNIFFDIPCAAVAKVNFQGKVGENLMYSLDLETSGEYRMPE